MEIATDAGGAAVTAGEKAYRRIRNDIIFGVLAPSQKLRLDRLREGYGVSISTLRELLNRLTSEGLVVAESARGFEVAPVSTRHFREIAALRQLLESHAIEQSFSSGDVEWEGRVVAAHHKLASMEQLMKNGERNVTEQWKRYDWQFHQALISACGSHSLMEAHASVFDQYLRYQMLAMGYRGDIAIREHRMLLDCALERDAATACTVLTAHIDGGVEHALAVKAI